MLRIGASKLSSVEKDAVINKLAYEVVAKDAQIKALSDELSASKMASYQRGYRQAQTDAYVANAYSENDGAEGDGALRMQLRARRQQP